jgi:uncharacterized protein YcfL
MRYLIIILASLMLVGCAAKPPTLIDGDNIQTLHGVYRVQDALDGAAAYCELRLKKVKFIKSDCSEVTCVSSYQCINK